jgi:hypothetical protein
MQTKSDKQHNYTIIARLDDAIPLQTEEWLTVERLLNQTSEFVPTALLNSLTEAVVAYADDQARRGYLLGQDDFVKELQTRLSRIA